MGTAEAIWVVLMSGWAGQGQEYVFEARSAQGQVADLQARGGKPPGELCQDLMATANRQDDPARAVIYHRRPGSEPGQRPGQRPWVAARQCLHFEAVTASACPELARCPAGDDLAAVQDHDGVG